MKTPFIILVFLFFSFAGLFQVQVRGQENPVDTTGLEPVETDTVWVDRVVHDTIWLETLRIDTVVVEKEKPAAQPEQIQAPAEKAPKSKEKSKKAYYGGYANLSFGKYTVVGFEPLFAYKLLPKFSVGAKISYEYVWDKRYDTNHEMSNYGFSLFARRLFFRKLYAHMEYSKMNYKLYDSLGDSERDWVSFFYLGGGVRLPISKNTSFTAEVLWDLTQDENSPYKTVEPFVNVGIGVGF